MKYKGINFLNLPKSEATRNVILHFAQVLLSEKEANGLKNKGGTAGGVGRKGGTKELIPGRRCEGWEK